MSHKRRLDLLRLMHSPFNILIIKNTNLHQFHFLQYTHNLRTFRHLQEIFPRIATAIAATEAIRLLK